MADNLWTSIHTKLREELTRCYLDKADAQRIAAEAGLDLSSVKFGDNAANTWFAIIREADAQNRLIPLIARAIDEHKNNETLKKVLDTMRGSLGSSVSPGEEYVQEAEVEGINPYRDQREGGYLIDEPPADWVVDDLTMRELLQSTLGTDLGRDDASNPFVEADRFDQRDILRVRSQTQLRIEYDPGNSLISGRPTLQFLPDQRPVAQLVIMPLERQSFPPSFVEQTLEHTFLTQLIPILPVANLDSLLVSTTRKTNRLRLTAELSQRINHVTVNGIPNQSLTANITMIGIQGYTRDYLLMLTYISQATLNKAGISNQTALLQFLVDSFKLIKPANREEQERQLRAAGDKRYNKYVELIAGSLITFQFNLLREQWKGLDWDIADSSRRVVSDSKLIQKAIKAFPFQAQEIDSLSQWLEEIDQMTPEEIRGLFV